jgi:hypothetical protein
VYRSSATDIVPGVPAGPNLVLFDRNSGSNSVLNPPVLGADWSSWVSNPFISADGRKVFFQSGQSSLVAGDFNRGPDIFSGPLALALDSDNDGIPDWWMIKYFGHATGMAADHSLRNFSPAPTPPIHPQISKCGSPRLFPAAISY